MMARELPGNVDEVVLLANYSSALNASRRAGKVSMDGFTLGTIPVNALLHRTRAVRIGRTIHHEVILIILQIWWAQ